MDSSLSVTYTHSAGEGHVGPQGVVFGNMVNKQGLKESNIVSRGRGYPWFPLKYVIV